MEHCYTCFKPPSEEVVVCDGWSEEDIRAQCDSPTPLPSLGVPSPGRLPIPSAAMTGSSCVRVGPGHGGWAITVSKPLFKGGAWLFPVCTFVLCSSTWLLVGLPLALASLAVLLSLTWSLSPNSLPLSQ